MYALSNTAIQTASTIATVAELATETAAWIRAIDEEFVQSVYENIADYVKTDALQDFSTVLATIIVYTNKLAQMFGYGFLNAPTTEPAIEVFAEPVIENVPTEIFAPVVYSLSEVFHVEKITLDSIEAFQARIDHALPFVVEVVNSDIADLEALKLQAKQLGIKGWNLYKDSSKLQIKINKELAQQHK